ncbi:MAG: cytochrome c oxidase subunit II [Sphingobacteriales bacterium JAD_PAG50586_3]|nr:MAG: cytochrome c oxidase subunit II [Sphingobacteriales bacterium JAD_PAG50586_3]
MDFLILAIIILAVVAIFQLLKIYELARELRPDEAPVITEADSRMNGRLGILFIFAFFGFILYCILKWKDQLLPVSASKHGVEIDQLWDVSMVIITIPFVICNVLLFFFLNKYRYKKERKADFFAHSNKLEAVWTIVPAIVLSALIIYGLRVWNSVTDHTSVSANENPINIELYARQFDWTARYAGTDNKLGDANYQMINGTNALGLITPAAIEGRLKEIDDQIAELTAKLKVQVELEGKIFPKKSKPIDPHHSGGEEHGGGHGAAPAEHHAPAPNPEAHPAEGGHGGGHHEDPYAWAGSSKPVMAIVDELKHLERMKKAIEVFAKKRFISSEDDLLVKGEFHIPVNKAIVFQFRAQDVIHSAYMPHFRTQMNAVPGMKTNFAMTPTITTAEMRKITNNPNFEYYLLCNKICGNAHYNMKMVIVVEDQASYDKWVKEQKTFGSVLASNATEGDSTAVPVAKADSSAIVPPAAAKSAGGM